MAYVITDACIKDFNCIETCSRKCIHPTQEEGGWEAVPQLYINPKRCTDCGACIPVCEQNAIFAMEELPDNMLRFAEINAAYYRR